MIKFTRIHKRYIEDIIRKRKLYHLTSFMENKYLSPKNSHILAAIVKTDCPIINRNIHIKVMQEIR